MRWREAARIGAVCATCAVGALALCGAGAALASDEEGESAAAPDDDAIEARADVLERAERMVVDKRALHAAELRVRTRAAYKLFRAGYVPLWIDEAQRTAMVQRRAAMRRALARDVRELALLDEELAVLARARAALDDEGADGTPPPPASLHRPVPGRVIAAHGLYRHDTGVVLSRRGVELSARASEPVRAVADGQVLYVGAARGLGTVLLIAHDGFLSVIGRVDEVLVTPGQPVDAGAVIARAAGARIYLEIRLPVGPGGLPIDPAPLLQR